MFRQCFLFAVVMLVLVSGTEVVRADVVLYGYAPSFGNRIMEIDSSTGATSNLSVVMNRENLSQSSGAITSNSAGAILSIDGQFGSGSVRLFQIDPATGIGTAVGNVDLDWQARFIEYNPATNTLYAGTTSSNTAGFHDFVPRLYTIDQSTGAASEVTVISGLNATITALAIDSAGNAYATAFDGTAVNLYSLNLTSGVGALIGSTGLVGSSGFYDLAFSPTGDLYGAYSGSGIYTINVNTGLATSQSFPPPLGGLAFVTTPAPVPEPSSLLLLGSLGVGAAGWCWRRRGKAAGGVA